MINTCRDSAKNIFKFKMLTKNKKDKEKQQLEKILAKINFTKYELEFVLDKLKKSKSNPSSISVTVENELNNQIFVLDDKEVMCKL